MLQLHPAGGKRRHLPCHLSQDCVSRIALLPQHVDRNQCIETNRAGLHPDSSANLTGCCRSPSTPTVGKTTSRARQWAVCLNQCAAVVAAAAAAAAHLPSLSLRAVGQSLSSRRQRGDEAQPVLT